MKSPSTLSSNTRASTRDTGSGRDTRLPRRGAKESELVAFPTVELEGWTNLVQILAVTKYLYEQKQLVYLSVPQFPFL